MALMQFPIDQIRADFPMLAPRADGRPFVYLDSAATNQKPQAVIDRLVQFYAHEYGTTRRGAYATSRNATAMYEDVRAQVRGLINARQVEEIVFVSGVTGAINLVANAWGRANLRPGDEVVLTQMEHHANIVPWQLVAKATGAVLRYLPVQLDGTLDLEAARSLIGPRTRMLSFVHVSNALGTLNPAAQLIEMAHAVGALTLLDGAQSVAHLPVDVQALGCDFFVASGHKMLGPTGVGFLYGRHELLTAMDPWQGGGEMIVDVYDDHATWEEAPYRFEAGTQPFAQVIGLGAAITYLQQIGLESIAARDRQLVDYATTRLDGVPGLVRMGNAPERVGVVPFTFQNVHVADIAHVLDEQGICVRVGQHCAQPLLRRFGVTATARASFGVYTTEADIDALVDGLVLAVELLA